MEEWNWTFVKTSQGKHERTAKRKGRFYLGYLTGQAEQNDKKKQNNTNKINR